ncbi:MAG: PaaI family thioesterase [Bacteroidales bacterium]
MKKLHNPYAEYADYSCFGCAPDNPAGLQLQFFEDGDYIMTQWDPEQHLEGFFNVLHGGIQATLLDEAASWVVFVKAGTAGLTSKMNVRYKQAVKIDEGTITVRARLMEMKRNVAVIYAEILDAEEKICAYAHVEYFTFSPEKAKEKLYYPGLKKFLGEEH